MKMPKGTVDEKDQGQLSPQGSSKTYIFDAYHI